MRLLVSLLALSLVTACSAAFAQDAYRNLQVAQTRPGGGPASFGTQPRSQASLTAEARVREMETLVRLTAEGEALYQEDNRKPQNPYQYCSMSFAFSERGEFREAVRAASKALFLGQRDRNEDLVAHAKRDLALAYSYAGNMERAQQYAEEALNHYTHSRDRASVHSWSYKVLGDVYMRRGDMPKAIAMYEKSVGAADNQLRFFSRASIASAYVVSGEVEKAKDALGKAESYLDVLGGDAAAAGRRTLLRIKGNLALKQNKPDEARQFFENAVQQVSGPEQAYQRFWALEGSARAQLARGDKAAALKSYLEAITASEQVRARFRSEEIKSGLFGEMQQVFDEAVQLSMESGQAELAWEVSERGRSRALLDMVRNRVKLAAGTEAYADPLGKTIKLGELQALLRPGDAVVEYHVMPARSYAWIVRNGSVSRVTIEIRRSELAKQVERLRDALSQQTPNAAELGAKLYDALLRPLGVKDGESLVIVPHDALHYAPFQALRDGNAYLIEKSAVSYAPSASALAALLGDRAAKSGKLLALGNPDLGNPQFALPGAQREVERVKTLFAESEVYFQKDATKRRLITSASRSNLVHIAAHADVDALDPLYSRIHLARAGEEPGVLEAHEVYAMSLHGVGLVALSACETGLGKVSRGDEIWGFTRSFLSAGSSALLVSLWPVADESTERLMARFYQELGKGGARSALRSAQLDVMKEPKFSHPFFWAPFNLVGDWR